MRTGRENSGTGAEADKTISQKQTVLAEQRRADPGNWSQLGFIGAPPVAATED
jgi:hypothetical protein